MSERLTGCAKYSLAAAQQIIDLGLADLHVVRIAGVVPVGGADQREFVHVRNGEDDAASLFWKK